MKNQIYNVMNDFTSYRMLGYLYRSSQSSVEEVVDEMVAIISERDRLGKNIDRNMPSQGLRRFIVMNYSTDCELTATARQGYFTLQHNRSLN